jgi:hypothetical protein
VLLLIIPKKKKHAHGEEIHENGERPHDGATTDAAALGIQADGLLVPTSGAERA